MNRWRRMIRSVGLSVCLLLTGCASEKPVATSENAPSPTPTPAAATDAPKSLPPKRPPARKRIKSIIYLVNLPEAAKDLSPSILNGLIRSLASLRPQHYFQIIFLGENKPMLMENGQLMRATGNIKIKIAKALKNPFMPKKTTVLPAVKEAFALLENTKKNQRPGAIYLITANDFGQENHQLMEYLLKMKAETDQKIIFSIFLYNHSEDSPAALQLKAITEVAGEKFGIINKPAPTRKSR